jgi:hypothetical protein
LPSWTNSLTLFSTMTTSLQTPTAPLTSPLSMTQRETLAEFIALKYLDAMDLRDLERFFLDVQMEYLGDYTDEEMIAEVEDLTDTEEFNAMMEVEV